MRKILLVILAVLCIKTVEAQGPSLQQKLYYTTKVWGFAKYYHSNVSTCGVNWDSVLLHVLPMVRSAATDSAFNDALDTMLVAAGPMALATTTMPTITDAELKRNLNFNWISSPALRVEVQTILDTIKNNFRPHNECWVMNNSYTNGYRGWLVFPHDSLELNTYTTSTYPDDNHRQLMFMKYWNIVNYFYPYNYVLDSPWDTTLMHYAAQVDTVASAPNLFHLIDLIASNLCDDHTEGLTWSNIYYAPLGYFQPPIRLSYIQGQYVVLKSSVSGVAVGDAIISVDGFTIPQWEDSLRPVISAGNSAVFHRTMSEYLLSRNTLGTSLTLVVQNSIGTNLLVTTSCIAYKYNNYGSYIYPADSLNTIHWTSLDCNVGYVNMGNLVSTEVNQMYSELKTKQSIIFDLRNYPNGTAWAIANLMYPYNTIFAKLTMPSVTYPGSFIWDYENLGMNGNPDPYNGKVIILMNEQTLSQAEYSCMIFSAMPNVVKVGSQTSGADGNITYWRMAQDIHAGMTNLGVFWPNGDSTQRIGIVPDSVVYPTKVGIRHRDDEVLDKAISIAGCSPGSVATLGGASKINIYPNPVRDGFYLDISDISVPHISIEISSMTGNVILEKSFDPHGGSLKTKIDIGDLASGIYIITINEGAKKTIKKLTKI